MVNMENFCAYCSVMLPSEVELKAHCLSESHQLTIMSDEGREWKFRAPARGVGADQYSLCPVFAASGKCRLGQQCCDAHGEEELNEWRERFVYRQAKLQRAKECQLQGSHYSEQLLEKWLTSTNPTQVMKERLDNVEVSVDPDTNITVSEKNCAREWTFHISSKTTLRHVALLYETHRSHFRLFQVIAGQGPEAKEYIVEPQCQEWSNADSTEYNNKQYICKVRFVTSIYGTFRQAVVFDFGVEPVLVQKLSVDVVSVSDLEKLQQARESVVSFTERWSSNEVTVVPFDNRPYALGEKEQCLLSCYSAPDPSKFTVTQAVMEPTLTKSNYSSRQHELLCIEEMAQYELLSRYNVKAHINLSTCYLLTPNSAATAKYAHNGELFANMQLSSVLSEDSASGRLVLTNCNTVLLAPVKTKGEEHRKVYEAVIEDKGKTVIYIRLSKQCVEELKLKPDREFLTEVQFQLNRLPLCEMHFAIDRLHPPSIVFPDVTTVPPISWNSNSCLPSLDARLNPKQKEAVTAIITSVSVRLPPVLIIGPFGTGKTFTLAQAVKMLISDPQSRILVCTHSNSAADIYIREYLHPQVAEGHIEATPLRIYYRHRWVATVHPTVLQYCLVSSNGNDRAFNMPTVEDVKKYKVIVTTLSTSRYLVQLGLEKGFFTHILIDEAAQAMECEAIMPLSLADESTRIVLAGDHMQLSPEVYSQFAQQRNLHTSLLERLYDLYPEEFPCKVLLCENYRSHEAIIRYTSELFYDNHLTASGQQPRHEKYFPLTFFTTRGEDIQDLNSTAFHNNAEVYEIVERVIELRKSWPDVWGDQDETSIGVVTPYYDQVVRIRAELRKKKLHGVSVERVLNVQGKQFRVIILSTVRTRQTCNSSKAKSESDLDHGFLSNARLLNTAITRGQSLVAVVGDPISLCSVGKCRKLWEKFIYTCHENSSLFGITWDSLRSHLDSMELKKNFILNPLAPEFVPGRMFHGQPSVPFSSGEFICHSSTPSPQPLFLFSFPSPFQGPPIIPSAVAHMMPSHPYNVGLNCLGPSIMPPPPHPFQAFPYNAAAPPPPPAPRTTTLHPRMSAGIFPRKQSNLRPLMTVDPNLQVRDFERGMQPGRQNNKRNEGYTLFNNVHKQTSIREEQRSQSHEEAKQVLSQNELQRNHNSFSDSMEVLSNFRNIQNNLYNVEEKTKLNFMKTENNINGIVKSFPTDTNNFNVAPEIHIQQGVKTTNLNGMWCPLPESNDSSNVLTESFPVNLENNTVQTAFCRPLVNGEISSTVIERVMPDNIDGPVPSQSPLQTPQVGCNVEKPVFSVDGCNRFELISQLPALQTSLQEKLCLLEKVLPIGTDLKTFLESPVQPKMFFNHLLTVEGPLVAKRFVNLFCCIKRDQEFLVKYQHLSNVMEKSIMRKGFQSAPVRSMDQPVPSALRNGFGSQFPVSRSQLSPQQQDLPNGHEPFRLDIPVTPFPWPVNVEKNESRLFANGNYKNGFIKSHLNIPNNFLKTWEVQHDGNSGWTAPVYEKSQEQLSFEFSKGVHLGRNEGAISKHVFPENGIGSENIDLSQRVDIERKIRENQKQWLPLQPLGSDNFTSFSSQESYLSKLRSISSSASNSEASQSPSFESCRSDFKRPVKDFDSPAQMTPLSVSYPDIPDILSSHILPTTNDSTSSKVIQKPNASRLANDPPSSNIHSSQHLFDFSLTRNNSNNNSNNSGSLQYSSMPSEGMTYAKILRSPQP